MVKSYDCNPNITKHTLSDQTVCSIPKYLERYVDRFGDNIIAESGIYFEPLFLFRFTSESESEAVMNKVMSLYMKRCRYAFWARLKFLPLEIPQSVRGKNRLKDDLFFLLAING